MQSRIASNCLWLGRYLERAENGARLVGAANAVSGLLDAGEAQSEPWLDAVKTGADLHAFRALGLPVEALSVARFMLVDRANPSSVVSCLRSAGANAETARHLLGDAFWEAVNTAWIGADELDPTALAIDAIATVSDWALERCRLIRGTGEDLLRDELTDVLAIGASIERIDFTACLLGVMLPAALDRQSPPVATREWHRIDAVMLSAGTRDDFRRLFPGTGSTADAAGLLMSLVACPRSLACNLLRLERCLAGFSSGDADHAIAEIAQLRTRLADAAGVTGDWKIILGEIHLGIGAIAMAIERELLSNHVATTLSQRQSEG